MVDAQLTKPEANRQAEREGGMPPSAAGRPVLMLVHSYYEEDPRVRREAETLAAAGYAVTVLGLRRPGDPPSSSIAGVELRRLDVQRHQGAGLWTYLREYLSFLVRSAWRAARLHRQRRFRLVQVHSLPDFLAFAALPLRVAGVPLILDLHEAMPEFFRTRFPRASNPLVDGLLRLQERLSISIANQVLTVNDAMYRRLIGLGVPAGKIQIVINSPSLARFDADSHPRRDFAADGCLRLVYTGALTPVYELDVSLRAIAEVLRLRPDLDVRFDLYGRGDSEPDLRALAAELRIAGRVTFHGRIPIEAVPAAVAAADIGIAPTRLDEFTHMTLSTKVYEYAAMGKPVVASRLPMVEQAFPTNSVRTYEPGAASAMAHEILAFVDDPADRAARVDRTLDVVRAAAWERASRPYVELVARLTSRPH